jgi:hypothetical protein
MPPQFTLHELCTKRCRGATLARVCTALLILVTGISAQAATVPFTFELTYDVFVVGVPSPSTLTLPTTVSGSGSFAPFGPAIYSEAGTVTFESSPSGELVTSTVTNSLIASFNGGTDTLTGTHSHVFGVSDTWTILGGHRHFHRGDWFRHTSQHVDPAFWQS